MSDKIFSSILLKNLFFRNKRYQIFSKTVEMKPLKQNLQVNLSLTAVNENTKNRQNRDIVKCEKIRA